MINRVNSWLPVLTFHSIDDQRSPISYPPSVFAQAVSYFKSRGCETIDLISAVDMLRTSAVPKSSLVMTFDDGYESVYREAFPALLNQGMTATVFLTVGLDRAISLDARLPSLHGRSMLSWRQIVEMKKSGVVSFGAHTLTHPDLTSLSAERTEVELRDSKSIIEDALGCCVPAFAYPFGRYDDRCTTIAKRLFECACSDRLGLARVDSDSYALERVDAYYLRSVQTIRQVCSSSFPLYISLRSIPRRIKRIFQ